MTEFELAGLEYELFVRPPSDEDAALCATRLADGSATLADRLRYYLWLVPPTEDRRHEWRMVGPHLIELIREAPFLRSVNTTGVAEKDSPEHQELQAAWLVARARFGDSPEVLRRAFEFYYDWSVPQATAVIDSLLAIDADHPTTLVYAGYLHLKGADCLLPGYSYVEALRYFDAAMLPGTAFHVASGSASTAAFESSQIDSARALAEEAISAPGYGMDDQAHFGWTTLGRIALAGGDRDEALSHLEASIVACISHAGPSLRLAADLARRGETSAASSFIKRISSRWKGPTQRSSLWLKALEAGDTSALLNPGR